MRKIKSDYEHGLRTVLRWYLYDILPRSAQIKARFPKINVLVNSREFTYSLELRDMSRPYQSRLREPAGRDHLFTKISRFNHVVDAYRSLHGSQQLLDPRHGLVLNSVKQNLQFTICGLEADLSILEDGAQILCG